MSAAVMSLPPNLQSMSPHPLSRPATPTRNVSSRPGTPTPQVQRIRSVSRPCTPPPPLAISSHLNFMQPISAPHTPVTATHLNPIAMERCRSSEAVLGSHKVEKEDRGRDGRGGRKRDVKATSLLFHKVPSAADISTVEGGMAEDKSANHTPVLTAVQQVEDDEEDHKMDVDEVEVDVAGPEEEHRIWGMPKWGWEEERKEVRKGVRLVGMEEVSGR